MELELSVGGDGHRHLDGIALVPVRRRLLDVHGYTFAVVNPLPLPLLVPPKRDLDLLAVAQTFGAGPRRSGCCLFASPPVATRNRSTEELTARGTLRSRPRLRSQELRFLLTPAQIGMLDAVEALHEGASIQPAVHLGPDGLLALDVPVDDVLRYAAREMSDEPDEAYPFDEVRG